MDPLFKRLFHRFLFLGFVVFICSVLIGYIIVPTRIFEVTSAYLLSFVFVGSNFAVIKDINKESQARFYRRFFTAMGLRLFFVLAAIVAILATTGFHQIYFTVSFIFSYILHSVIEIITIEKLLQKDNLK